jgi:hypothetical protein
LEREDKYADKEFIKAFRLAQLIIEYLLIVQNKLSASEKEAKYELDLAMARNEQLESDLTGINNSTRPVIFEDIVLSYWFAPVSYVVARW